MLSNVLDEHFNTVLVLGLGLMYYTMNMVLCGWGWGVYGRVCVSGCLCVDMCVNVFVWVKVEVFMGGYAILGVWRKWRCVCACLVHMVVCPGAGHEGVVRVRWKPSD